MSSVEEGKAYCKWHLMAHRLANIWRWNRSDVITEPSGWMKEIVPALITVLASTYFRLAILHFARFHSGINPDKDLEYNLSYALLFLGLSILLIGLGISLVRKEQIPDWFNRLFYLWVGVLLAISIILYRLTFATAPGNLRKAADFLFIVPVGLTLLRADKRTGKIAPTLVIIGLAVILVSGLFTPLMEILHYFTGGFEYLNPMPPEQRSSVALHSVMSGLMISVAAIEAVIALYSTGYMLTPLRFESNVFIALMALFGQANILRHMLIAIFGQYVFDFFIIPIIGVPPLFYLAIVFFLHFVLLRKQEKETEPI